MKFDIVKLQALKPEGKKERVVVIVVVVKF